MLCRWPFKAKPRGDQAGCILSFTRARFKTHQKAEASSVCPRVIPLPEAPDRWSRLGEGPMVSACPSDCKTPPAASGGRYPRVAGAAVGGSQGADVDAQATGNRGANRVGVECLPRDLAGFEDILRQDAQGGLIAQVHPQIVYTGQQVSLRQVNFSEQGHQSLVVVDPVRLVIGLPGEALIRVFHAVMMVSIHSRDKLFSANNAAKRRGIHRVRYSLSSRTSGNHRLRPLGDDLLNEKDGSLLFRSKGFWRLA